MPSNNSNYPTKLIILTISFVIIPIAAYIVNFHDTPVTKDPGDWGIFGDYIGGLINPTLSFISVLILARSIHMQSASQRDATSQFNSIMKREALRSHDELMRTLTQPLGDPTGISITYTLSGRKPITISGKLVASHIENLIENQTIGSNSTVSIEDFIGICDINDDIYETHRRFATCLKIIESNLSKEAGFVACDRRVAIETLISLTCFHKLRLIKIGIENLRNPQIEYLKSSEDFIAVATKLELIPLTPVD